MQDQTFSALLLTIICTIGSVSGQDAYPVVISSFAGSVVFVMSAVDIPLFKRWIFFFISFFLGISLSKGAANLVADILPFTNEVDQSIGALISSAVIVRFAIFLSSGQNSTKLLSSLFKKLGGDK